MQAAMVPKSSITAYMMRVDVELRHDGHAEQQRLHAALPQQHASCNIQFNNLNFLYIIPGWLSPKKITMEPTVDWQSMTSMSCYIMKLLLYKCIYNLPRDINVHWQELFHWMLISLSMPGKNLNVPSVNDIIITEESYTLWHNTT